MSGRGKPMCAVCGVAPTAFPRVDRCFGCWPGGPVPPPPCFHCGSRTQYFVAGLCHRCHRDGHPSVDSCRDCYAWGATRNQTWYCTGCRSWTREHTTVDACTVCARVTHLDDDGVCRLCRKQGTFWREPHKQMDLIAANRHGQQLFLADLFIRRDRTQPAPIPRPVPATLPVRTHRHRQLALFDVNRDLTARGHSIAGLADRADPAMAAAVDQIIRRRAERLGWRHDLAWEVRTGTRVLLGFQEDPGDPITASDAAVLAGTDLPMGHVLDVLDDAGLLIDDRTPTIRTWFEGKVEGLPEPMTAELQRWFDIMLTGSRSTPRRRPRAHISAQIYLNGALPALHRWAAAGHSSLREITVADVRAVLPPSGNPRATAGSGLRSIFTVLKANKVLFTNPISQVKTGYQEPRQPLPLVPALLRAGLDSPDPARAAIIALIAYHGLRSGQLRNLQLTDVHDGRLHLDGRTIPLAEPVRTRISAYLDYRNRSWPRSANPHLFLTSRSAVGLNPPGARWVKLKIDITGGPQAVREDRILHEAHASGGDIRRLCDMFGLSVSAAERYTATVDNPDLIAKAGHARPGADPA